MPKVVWSIVRPQCGVCGLQGGVWCSVCGLECCGMTTWCDGEGCRVDYTWCDYTWCGVTTHGVTAWYANMV